MSDEIMDLSTVAQETAEPTETIETDPVESNDAEIDSVEMTTKILIQNHRKEQKRQMNQAPLKNQQKVRKLI